MGKYASEKVIGAPGELSPKTKACDGAVEMYPHEGSKVKYDFRLLPAFLENSYRAWAATKGKHAQAAGTSAFWEVMTKLGFEAKKSGKRYRTLPTEADLRAKLAHLDEDEMG